MLNGPFGGGLNQLLQDLLTDDTPNVVSLSPNTIGVLPALQTYQDLEFSAPGGAIGTITAISPTPPDGVNNQFYVRTDVGGGGLLISDGVTPGAALTVSIGQGSAPSVALSASVAGQSGGSGTPLQFASKSGQLLQVTLSAGQSSPGSGAFTSFLWQDGNEPIGTGQITTVQLAAGLHKIYCVIQNSVGLSATGELDIAIASPAPPVVHFSMTQDGTGSSGSDVGGFVATVGTGTTVSVSLKANVVSSNSIAVYTWTSDGAQIGTGAVVDYSFPVGQHSILLQIVDSQGSAASASATLTLVSSALKAAFNFSTGSLTGQENSQLSVNISPGGSIQALRANMDETDLLVVITEQGENRNPREE